MKVMLSPLLCFPLCLASAPAQRLAADGADQTIRIIRKSMLHDDSPTL